MPYYINNIIGPDFGKQVFYDDSQPSRKVGATPNIPEPVPAIANQDIKIATPDLIEFAEDAVPVEYMTDLLFEQIGGQEIISISRNDIVNGQTIVYQPIKNISQLAATFSPLNLFASIDDTNSYFKNFTIKLDERVPEIGANQANNEVIDVVFIDPANGNLIINTVNMLPNERLEVQILNSGDATDDIIY
jgi:hypothetical protein